MIIYHTDFGDIEVTSWEDRESPNPDELLAELEKERELTQ